MVQKVVLPNYEHVRARGAMMRSLRAEFCLCVCYPHVSAASANVNNTNVPFDFNIHVCLIIYVYIHKIKRSYIAPAT